MMVLVEIFELFQKTTLLEQLIIVKSTYILQHSFWRQSHFCINPAMGECNAKNAESFDFKTVTVYKPKL